MHLVRLSSTLLCVIAAVAPARLAAAGRSVALDESVRALDARVDALATRALEAQVRALDVGESVPDPAAGATGPPDPEAPLDRARRRYARGLERARAGDAAGAATLLRAAIDAEPFREGADFPVAAYELGEALRQQGLWAIASPWYRRVLERPASPRAREALVRAMEAELRLGRPSAVPELLSAGRRAWGEAGVPPEARYLAAKAAFRRDDLPPADRDREALAAFATVPAPFEIAAAYHRGAIRVRAGDLREALREFEGCDRLAARTPRQEAQRLRCRLALARLHGDAGDYQGATHWYGRVLRESPGSDEARYELAVEYQAIGLHEAALRAISAIQDDAPPSGLANDVEILRAQILTGLGRFGEATAIYDRVRRRYEPARAPLDAILASGRGPGSGASASAGEIPPWVVEWARESGEAATGTDQLARLDWAETALAGAAAALDRAARGAVRGGDDALRARISDARREIAGATEDLERLRGEVRRPASEQARRAFEAARERMDALVHRADWGDVEVALARHAEARGDVRSRLSRRASEDYWPSSLGRRRAQPGSLPYWIRVPSPAEWKAGEEAVALLEDFLRRHPDDLAHAPRALAVLAELQYERTGREPASASADARGAGAWGDVPPAAGGCASAVDLYQRLATGFPDYRGKDEIYFLLGYCLGEMGRRAEALQAYATLIRTYPQSSRVPEAWVRTGDLSFEEATPESLARAAEAYRAVAAWPDHPLQPYAVYMLGWTWYRSDDLPRAVEAFTSLLDRPPAAEATGGHGPDAELWSEALRYVALSFASPGWDGIRMAREWSARLEGRPYVPAVFRQLADQLFDQARYPQAAEAYRHLLAADPVSAEAPRLQARIVEAWTRERRPDEEARARDALLAACEETGAWWTRHQGSPELLREARDLCRVHERAAATLHHRRAEELRKAGRSAEARAEYARAAEGYERHVRALADAKDAYEPLFAWADAAFRAEEFDEAARLYERVRDDPSSAAHREEAALDAVLAWEAEAERARRSGALEEKRVVLAKDLQGRQPVAEPLPPLLQALVEASDRFAGSFPGNARAPAVAYRAGEVLYGYGHLEEARRRLEAVAERWPGTEPARFAANLAIETHLATRDWAAVEEAAARLQGAPAARDAALAASLHRVELGSRFNRARGLLEEGQLEPAADLFLAIADEDPRGEYADKALFNAASALERARRLDRALPVFERLVAGHPGSALADEALFRLAWNTDGLFDLEKAAELYRRLAERYPRSRHRSDALLNGARALENLRRHGDAAELLVRFARASPASEEAAAALVRAARLQRRARAWAKEIEALRALVKNHAGTASADVLVPAHLHMGLAHRALGQEPQAVRQLAEAVTAFQRASGRPDPGGPAAAAAAEARFLLAEAELEKFDRISLPATANPKRLQQPLQEKLSEMRRVARLYDEVKAYKRPDWTIAAFYRQGYLLEQFARTLHEAPIPPELRRRGQEEYLAAYQDQLARFAQPYEDQAVDVYEKALAAARDLRVRNEWTVRIRKSLARHRPREHPALREVRGRLAGAAAEGAPVAEGAARATLARDPGNATALVALALAFEARGLPEAARAVLESARQDAPDDAAVWNRLGFVHRALGDGPRALESWRKASELRPDLADALVNQGLVLAEAQDHAGAVAVLERAVRMAPGHAVAWLDLGNAYRGAGRADEAQRAYEAALAADAGLADAWFNLGVLALEGSGPDAPAATRLERAMECFDRSVAAGGPDAEAGVYRMEAQSLLAREQRRRAGDAAQGAGEEGGSVRPTAPDPAGAP